MYLVKIHSYFLPLYFGLGCWIGIDILKSVFVYGRGSLSNRNKEKSKLFNLESKSSGIVFHSIKCSQRYKCFELQPQFYWPLAMDKLLCNVKQNLSFCLLGVSSTSQFVKIKTSPDIANVFLFSLTEDLWLQGIRGVPLRYFVMISENCKAMPHIPPQ